MDASAGSPPLTAGRVWTRRGTGWRLEGGKAKRPWVDLLTVYLAGWCTNSASISLPEATVSLRQTFPKATGFSRLQECL